MDKIPYYIRHTETTSISNTDFLYYDNNTDTAQSITYEDLKTQIASEIGAGDMTKAVYDPDDDGIVLAAECERIAVINKTGATLTKGTIVYVKSTSSSANFPEVLKADATTEATSSKTIGAIYEDIANDATGYIVTSGQVHNLNTSAYSVGDKLWLSTTAGQVTTTPPSEPNHTVFIGHVTRSQTTNGRILYAIQNGYELDELHGVEITSVSNNDVLLYNSTSGLWENGSVPTSPSLNSNFVLVNQKSDLPTAVSGVITLDAEKTYYFTDVVDLTGDRLVCGSNTTILGASSENCRIKSTGLTGTALITSVYSMPMRNITIEADVALNLDGDATTTALDWFGVNFTDCNTVGTIKDYTNFIMGDSAFLNSGGLTFDGTIGTIGMNNCLFDCRSTKTAITLASTLSVSRRFRIIYSSFVILSGETGINVSTSATISDERYILDTVNFSGGGTYVTGVTHTSNKALFTSCVGITNTTTRGFYYMVNNGTDTTIGVTNVNVWIKAAGTTTASANNSKFTHANNKLTYTGAFSTSFLVIINASVRSATTNLVISIGIAKNGTILTESEMTIRTAVANQEYPGSTQVQLELTTNDYVEVFVKNTTSPDIRVSDLNLSIIKIPV